MLKLFITEKSLIEAFSIEFVFFVKSLLWEKLLSIQRDMYTKGVAERTRFCRAENAFTSICGAFIKTTSFIPLKYVIVYASKSHFVEAFMKVQKHTNFN